MNNPINLVLLIFAVALAISAIVYYPILEFARKKNICDKPDVRKLQRRPVPVLGGLVVAVSMLLSVQLGWIGTDCSGLIPVEAAVLIMLVLGTIDDIKGLSPLFRLLMEALVAVGLIMVNGKLIDNLHGLWGIYEIPEILAWFLTIITVLGIVNAINLVDGVNGLSSGLCIISLGFYGLHLFLQQDYSSSFFSLAGVGALIPFFIHNVFGNRSRMFIGDGGTMMMGMLLSYLVIEVLSLPSYPGGVNRLFCPVAFVLAVLAIPVGDTLRVMITRMLSKQSPFHPDKTHLHHAFIKYGFTHLETALMEIILDAGIVGLWWLMYKSHFPQEWQLYIVIVAALSVVIGLYHLLGRKERLAAKRIAQGLPPEEDDFGK